MSDHKFLGICIVVAAILIAASMISLSHAQRYQLVQGAGQVYVQDTWTGDTYLGWKNLKK